MRFLLPLLLLAAPLSAAAQAPAAPTATLRALQRHFPLEHQPIAASLKGKSGEDARRTAYAGIDSFLRARRQNILAADGAMLVAIEARHASLLRILERQDVRLCARVGDVGFFSADAAAGAAPAGLDAYGVALVEAAASTAAKMPAVAPATEADVKAWIARVEAAAPEIPVRKMLADKAARAAASPEHLCRGAAVMHEAAAALPSPHAEAVSRMLVGAVIGAPRQR